MATSDLIAPDVAAVILPADRIAQAFHRTELVCDQPTGPYDSIVLEGRTERPCFKCEAGTDVDHRLGGYAPRA